MTIGHQVLMEELLDREKIRHHLARYCHAMDRQDRELLYETYWPEGTDDHGMFVGSGRDFVDWVAPNFEKFEMMQHQLGQTLILLSANQAKTETYFYAYHRVLHPEGRRDFLLSGRYLDLFEKRGDTWRILKRMTVYDWNRDWGASADWDHPLLGKMPRDQTFGKTTRQDFSWKHFEENHY